MTVRIYWADSSYPDCKDIEVFIDFYEVPNTSETEKIFKALQEFQKIKDYNSDWTVSDFTQCFPFALLTLENAKSVQQVFPSSIKCLSPDGSAIYPYISYDPLSKIKDIWNKYREEFLQFYQKTV